MSIHGDSGVTRAQLGSTCPACPTSPALMATPLFVCRLQIALEAAVTCNSVEPLLCLLFGEQGLKVAESRVAVL